MKQITDNLIEAAIAESSQKILLVDCSADWCAPCKKLKPVLEQIANENSEQIDVRVLDIEENPETVKKYQVRGIPTLLWFRNGSLVKTTVGSVSKQNLLSEMNNIAGPQAR